MLAEADHSTPVILVGNKVSVAFSSSYIRERFGRIKLTHSNKKPGRFWNRHTWYIQKPSFLLWWHNYFCIFYIANCSPSIRLMPSTTLQWTRYFPSWTTSVRWRHASNAPQRTWKIFPKCFTLHKKRSCIPRALYGTITRKMWVRILSKCRTQITLYCLFC